eukprot:UN32864
MAASRCGHDESVKYLLEAKADPHIQDKEYWNAAHYACFSGHDNVVKVLLKYLDSKDLEVVSKFEKATPIGFAIHRHFDNVVKLLDGNKSPDKLTVQEKGGHLARGREKLKRI